jgi:hypothetical protein
MRHRIRILSFLMAALIALLSAGCSGAPIRVNNEPKGPIDMTKGRAISAKACGFQLLLLIPIQTNGRQARAYDMLQSQAGKDYMANVSVKESWFYGFAGTGYCTQLDATAYPYTNP